MKLIQRSALVFGMSLVWPSWAQPLPQLWEIARTTEPSIVAARANIEVQLQRLRQVDAAFWPQINATASTNFNKRVYTEGPPASQQSRNQFNSRSGQINLTQAIYKRSNHVASAQAQLSLTQANRQYEAAENELFSKLLVAWCDWAASSSAHEAAKAQEAAALTQLRVTETGLTQGLNNSQQRDEAGAKWKQAAAELQAVLFDTKYKKSAVLQLVGNEQTLNSTPAAALPKQLPFDTFSNLEDLVLQVLENNASVFASQIAVQVAQQEVRKQRTGHEPTLELVLNHSFNSQDNTGNFPGQSGFKNSTSAAGIQLSIPIFSGGAQSAKVSEAAALLARADAELESVKRNVRLQVVKAWSGFEASSSKWSAAQLALISATSNLRQARAGLSLGTKTKLDELQALQMIEIAKRDAGKAYFDHVSNVSVMVALGAKSPQLTLQSIFRAARLGQ